MGSVPIFPIFHGPPLRAAAERPAVRGDAVSDGRRADAGVRHHESGQPGARLAVHDRRLPRGRRYAVDRQLPARRAARLRRHPDGRHGRRGGGAAHSLRARPPRPGARHLRPDPVLQRAGGDHLGPRSALYVAAVVAAGPHRAVLRVTLSGLSGRGHCGRPPGSNSSLVRGHAHPPGHADPRRRLEPHDGGGARRQHPPALYRGVRLRRRARRARRPDGGTDLRGAAGHGRADPDPGIRGDRHRRHRLDPPRAGPRDHRRHRRHAGARLPQAAAWHPDLADRRRIGRSGTRVDPDLPADGGGACRPALRAFCDAMNRRILLWGVAVLALVALPLIVLALNQPFYLDLVRRIMIFAIAAISLNLILGYGGMMSFGHAAYLGVGGYAVGILAFYGIFNGWLQFAVAVGASALVAAAIGAVSVRASGIYFIMITLAFTQMLYYLGISLYVFGGDDGMRLTLRSRFPLTDLGDPVQFYYFVLFLMILVSYLTHRIVESRFGMVIRAAKSNEARSRAIGFSPYPYRLAAFVIAGAMGGLAGALLVNQTSYLTPDFMHWTRSGEIMFMVILGGMGTLVGPVVGAIVLLGLEDVLSAVTEHWQIILGPFLVGVVLFAKRGLFGLLPGEVARDG